jgi:alanine racemase
MAAFNPINRRNFILSISSAPLLLAGHGSVQAAPVLSENNFGLTYEKVKRGNGWIEIDADQYVNNIRELRAIVGAKTKICVVIKADCYGHGISLLLHSLIEEGIQCVGFASNEEARVARTLGFKGELLRLRTATLEEAEDGMQFDIDEIAGNLADASALSELAQKSDRKLKVHFMLNSTSMSRNGLDLGTQQGKNDAIAIMRLKGLHIVGIMSHFPTEEVEDMNAGVIQFNSDVDWMLTNTGLNRKELTLHLANSYAALNVPASRLDMVRVGGAFVGDTDARFTQFKRIMTFKSKVVAVNAYPKGRSVSYDRTFELTRDSWLANIPIGYSDGYSRMFSRKNRQTPDKLTAYLLINGSRVPVVGRITMNTFMADVTDIRDSIKLGDEVVLYGRQGQEEITPADLEPISGTIATEFYTNWGNLMPKILKPRRSI